LLVAKPIGSWGCLANFQEGEKVIPAPQHGAGEYMDFQEIKIVEWEAFDSAGGLFALS